MTRIVVAGAVIVDGRLLLAQRARPAHLAGLWELPGGKVEAGETPADALRRELIEEVAIEVGVRERIGVAVEVADGVSLIALRADLVAGTARAREHLAVRWVDADELTTLCGAGDVVAADTAWLPDLQSLLREDR